MSRFKKGLNRVGKDDFSKAVRNLDDAVSVLVRTHYEPMGCFTCPWVGAWKKADCGHFRTRGNMSTRFDLRNLGLQCRSDNRFKGGLTYEFGQKLDELWGKGTADLMERRSRKLKRWDIKELEQLKSAAKQGWLIYLTLYKELDP